MIESLSDINDQTYDLIEDLARCFFTPKETSLMCEIEESTFMAAYADTTSKIYQRFQKGFLQSQYDLRKNILDLAKNGSSPAQTLALKLLEDATLKNLSP